MLKSKKFNIILALVVAIALWAYVLGEINPTSSTVVRNVPINFLNEETLAEEGLTVLSTSAETVNVTISGQRTAITRADSEDFTVTVDLEGMRIGENSARINVIGPRNVEIERVNIEKLTVMIDEQVSLEKSVETQFLGQIADNQEASVIEAEKNRVNVSGPKTLVNSVTRLLASISVSDLSGEPKNLNIELVPVDENNVRVEGVNTRSRVTMDVTAVLFNKKTVPLEVPLENQDSHEMDVEVDAPVTAVIKGSEDALAEISSISCQSIDLSAITESTTITLTPVLPEGVQLAAENPTLTADITVREMATRTFTFDSSDILFSVEAEGLGYSIADAQFEVTLTGRESVLAELRQEDIVLSVNTEGLTAGTHNLEISARCEAEVTRIEISPLTAEVVIDEK